MLLNYRFLIILLSILFFFTSKGVLSEDLVVKDSIQPYCDGINNDKILEENEIENIEIVTNNKRKWAENVFRILIEFNSEESKTHNTKWFNFRIDDKYKKKFKSNVFVKFKEKDFSCKFKAKIRVTGDLWWHIDWKKGSPITSIYVQLLDGHINNITRFKLLLPKSREGGDNEVFISSLMRELGFLAPRTFMLSSKINGVRGNYIFQEDLRKEFLENFQLTEGPILEGDERLTVDRIKDGKMIPDLSLSRIVNKDFSLKGNENLKTALFAVSNLNLIYLQHHQSRISDKGHYLPSDRLHINTEKFFLDSINRERFQIYESLIYALDAYHSLSFDDRRFYFDPINKYFLPIYYDGKSKIIDNLQKSKLSDLSKGVSIDAKKGAIKAIKLIDGMNHEIFQKRLFNYGINILPKDYDELIKKIIFRLEAIDNSEPLPVEFLKTKKYFSSLEKDIIKNRKLIFVNLGSKEFYICNFDLDKCNTKKTTDLNFSNTLADILSQRYKGVEKSYKTDAENLFVFSDFDYEDEKYPITDFWIYQNVNEDFILKHNKEIKIDILDDKKEIIIKQTSNSGRALILGKKVDGWNFVFNGSGNKINPYISKDHLNLTGCLTFLDIEVENVSIFSQNSSCEDSINFIRVNGNLNTVNISQSHSDAFDLDFSDIKIGSIEIKSAKNDCIDLSYGKYEINNVFVENCGDKAISVGEKSSAILKEVKINHSNTGVAVKDSSFVMIEESSIYNSPICFSAYRKKQEFSGAKIKILKTNCKKEQFFSQKGSNIILGL